MYTTSDFRIFNLTHPRYKNIQVITIHQDHVWINLNNLCETCRTTTTSALNSIIEFPEYLCYIKQNPQEQEFAPFITKEGFLVAQMGRSVAYKRQILNWIDNEIIEVTLPTSNQMIVLDTMSKPQPTVHKHNKKKYIKNNHIDYRGSQFKAYDCECNITELCHRYNEEGIDYTPQEFLSWLIQEKYISNNPMHMYLPRKRSYDRGYFVDNRYVFNSFYPQRDLRFTPKGQRHFFERLIKFQNN